MGTAVCGAVAIGTAGWWLRPCWLLPSEFVSAAASAAAALVGELSDLSFGFPTPSAAGLSPSCSSVSETRWRLDSVLACSCFDMMRDTITLTTFSWGHLDQLCPIRLQDLHGHFLLPPLHEESSPFRPLSRAPITKLFPLCRSWATESLRLGLPDVDEGDVAGERFGTGMELWLGVQGTMPASTDRIACIGGPLSCWVCGTAVGEDIPGIGGVFWEDVPGTGGVLWGDPWEDCDCCAR